MFRLFKVRDDSFIAFFDDRSVVEGQGFALRGQVQAGFSRIEVTFSDWI